MYFPTKPEARTSMIVLWIIVYCQKSWICPS